MRKLTQLLAIVAMAFAAAAFLPTGQIFAQDHSRPCDDQDPNCPGVAWTPMPGNPQTITISPGCVISIDIFTRNCHGMRQFRYGAYTVVPNALGYSNCNYLSSGTMTQLIDLYMIQNNIGGGGVGGGIPRCSDGSFTARYQFFSASCYALQTCTYTFPCDATINCDIEANNPPYPPTNHVFYTYTWFPCGTTCCEKEYDICLEQDGVTVDITRVRTTIPPCDNPPGYPNCQASCD